MEGNAYFSTLQKDKELLMFHLADAPKLPQATQERIVRDASAPVYGNVVAADVIHLAQAAWECILSFMSMRLLVAARPDVAGAMYHTSFSKLRGLEAAFPPVPPILLELAKWAPWRYYAGNLDLIIGRFETWNSLVARINAYQGSYAMEAKRLLMDKPSLSSDNVVEEGKNLLTWGWPREVTASHGSDPALAYPVVSPFLCFLVQAYQSNLPTNAGPGSRAWVFNADHELEIQGTGTVNIAGAANTNIDLGLTRQWWWQEQMVILERPQMWYDSINPDTIELPSPKGVSAETVPKTPEE